MNYAEKKKQHLLRKEIGSEFCSIPVMEQGKSGLFPEGTAWFLSGRSALHFVLDDILAKQPLRTVALPSWCCDSMIEPFASRGITIQFYPVHPDGEGCLVQDLSNLPVCDALLQLDYFGYLRQPYPEDFSGLVIRDATHSILTGVPERGDYVFGSLRKWAGFPTGGFAWKQGGFALTPPKTTDESYVALRCRAMEEKTEYLQGRREDKNYLSIFAEAEEQLDAKPIGAAASMEDISAAAALDVEEICRKRRENAAVLLDAFSHWALFPVLGEHDCPLFVPVLVPEGKRDALRSFLIQKEIYCPVHWPVSKLHRLTEQTAEIYENELSLVCDQRYTPEDMERMVCAIREFMENGA